MSIIIDHLLLVITHQIVVGCVGIAADVNFLVDQMRFIAQRYKSCYGFSIPVEILVKNICDIKQAYTQYANRRPFGVSIIYIGYDRHQQFQLYKSEPDGSYANWYGTCVGKNTELCRNKIVYLYNSYRESEIDITEEIACSIAINTFLKLNKQIGNFEYASNIGKISEKLKVVVISLKNNTPKINFLTKNDMETIISKFSGVFGPAVFIDPTKQPKYIGEIGITKDRRSNIRTVRSKIPQRATGKGRKDTLSSDSKEEGE